MALLRNPVVATCLGIAVGSVLPTAIGLALLSWTLRGGSHLEVSVAAAALLVASLFGQPSLLPWLALAIALAAGGLERRRLLALAIAGSIIALVCAAFLYAWSNRWLGAYSTSVGGLFTYPDDPRTWTAFDLYRVASHELAPSGEAASDAVQGMAGVRLGYATSLLITWGVIAVTLCRSVKWTAWRALGVLILAGACERATAFLNAITAGQASWAMLSFGFTALASLPVMAVVLVLPIGSAEREPRSSRLAIRLALFAVGALSLAFLSSLGTFGASAATMTRAPVAVGDSVPIATLSLPGGGSSSVRPARGHVAVVTFFADWCGPCLSELRALDVMTRDGAHPTLEVLAVGIEPTSGSSVAVSRLGLQITMAPAPAAAASFGVARVPTTLLVDDQGIVRFRHQGWNEDMPAQLADELGAMEAAARAR